MSSDLFGISFDDVVNNCEDDNRLERIEEIKRYESIYLLKNKLDYEINLSEISDDERLLLFNNVVFNGFNRNYIEDLTERDYSLECCTPYQITINNNVLENGSWGDILCKVVAYLITIYPEKKQEIFNFRCQWTNSKMFSETKKTNYKKIDTDLFLNCNHTALHSCWLLQDLLDFFGVDRSKVFFLIHRPSSVEAKELRLYIKKEFQKGFKNYLCNALGKRSEYADNVINNIDKYLNPILRKFSKSYNDFFLFDDTVVATSYIKRVKGFISSDLRFKKIENKIVKYFKYLLDFYKL